MEQSYRERKLEAENKKLKDIVDALVDLRTARGYWCESLKKPCLAMTSVLDYALKDYIKESRSKQ